MPTFRRRSTATLLTVIAGGLLLTGCTGGDHEGDLPKDYGQAWMSQMSTQLAGDFGGGGGRLTRDEDNEDRSLAGVGLQYDLEGPYDVLAVCRSASTVHLTVHDFTAEHDEYGDSLDTRKLIGEADIHCGATRRIPIVVPEHRDGIWLEATTDDTSGRALFDAFVVARGSKA